MEQMNLGDGHMSFAEYLALTGDSMKSPEAGSFQTFLQSSEGSGFKELRSIALGRPNLEDAWKYYYGTRADQPITVIHGPDGTTYEADGIITLPANLPFKRTYIL